MPDQRDTISALITDLTNKKQALSQLDDYLYSVLEPQVNELIEQRKFSEVTEITSSLPQCMTRERLRSLNAHAMAAYANSF